MGCTGAAPKVQSQDIRKLGGRMKCTGAAPKKIWTYIFEDAGRMVGCAAPGKICTYIFFGAGMMVGWAAPVQHRRSNPKTFAN